MCSADVRTYLLPCLHKHKPTYMHNSPSLVPLLLSRTPETPSCTCHCNLLLSTHVHSTPQARCYLSLRIHTHTQQTLNIVAPYACAPPFRNPPCTTLHLHPTAECAMLCVLLCSKYRCGIRIRIHIYVCSNVNSDVKKIAVVVATNSYALAQSTRIHPVSTTSTLVKLGLALEQTRSCGALM
jgi:hypothetical protein